MVRYLLGDRPTSLELSDITQKELDFSDASFFTANPEGRLPTTAEVRALSKDIDLDSKPVPIKYEDLGLIVKLGPHTTLTEALNLWMIKTVFGDEIPVPEVFGWRVDDEGYVFIYMELIKEPTLGECWDRLSMQEKGNMKDQLSQTMEKLRNLAQDPSDRFIGSIDRGHLLDYVFISQPQSAPFPSIKAFNDWFALLHQLPFEHRYDDPNRRLLLDDGDIKFTHCDLNRVNMIVVSRSPARLVLVDWEQAGWYPEYWEYCKALYTCWFGNEWHLWKLLGILSDRPVEEHGKVFFLPTMHAAPPRMATAGNGRTHTKQTGTPDYDDPVFWDNKFSSGRDVGEWLNPGEPLIDAVMSHLDRRPALDEPAPSPRALHLGPGISKLGSKLCAEFTKRGWPGSQILNVDFSFEAVRIGRETEATKEQSQAMHWMQVDLRSWEDVSRTIPYGPFDVVFDKSTSDAIATAAPLTFPSASEASNTCPTIRQIVEESGEITLSPVEVLALHLAPLTQKGAIWATISYSTMRYDNLPYLARYWHLNSRTLLRAPKGETSSFAHTPDVFHWLYILERK